MVLERYESAKFLSPGGSLLRIYSGLLISLERVAGGISTASSRHVCRGGQVLTLRDVR